MGIIKEPQRIPQTSPIPEEPGGLSRTFHLQGTSLRVPRPTYRLPEAPDAPTLCSSKGSTCPRQLAHRHCGEGSSKPQGGNGERGTDVRASGWLGWGLGEGGLDPWLTPLSLPAGPGPRGDPPHRHPLQECGLPQSGGPHLPRPACEPGPGPAVPQVGEARAPGWVVWLTGQKSPELGARIWALTWSAAWP